MNLFLVILMYASWSSMFAFGKMALEYAPPIFLTSIRMLLAGALLVGYLLLRKRSSLNLSKKEWALLGLLSLFSIYLTNVFEFWSLTQLTAAKTCFIYSFCPFFAALFSYLHFKEKMNLKKWLGMIIGFIGFIPILATQKGSEELLTTIPFVSWPELAMVGASLSTAYGWVLLRILVTSSSEKRKESISPMTANGLSMLLGGLLALFHSFFTDTWNPLPIEVKNIGSLSQLLVVMTLISNIFCYNLYGYLLKKYTATFLSFMGLLSPVFASLTSWIFLGETPSTVIFLSMTIVSLGLWMVYSAELKQGYIRSAPPQTTT